MKLLLKTATALVLTIATLAGCSASTTTVASSRDVDLAQRAESATTQPIDCGQPGGQCTVHFHSAPKARLAAELEATQFPLELPKPEHLSSNQ